MAKRPKEKSPVGSQPPKGAAQKPIEEPIDPKEFVLNHPGLWTEAPPPPPNHPLVLTGAGESPDPNVRLMFTLWTRRRYITQVGHALNCEFSTLAAAGSVDALIVATEDGFSPLGAARHFLSSDLGIPQDEIARRADWNRFENQRVTLIALAPRRAGSLLKGVILAPGETSTCYKEHKPKADARPHRDFYYSVTHEAIVYASRMWGARRLGISHLSASGNFHEDIAKYQVEALAHFCDQAPLPVIETFLFVGCCIEPRQFEGINGLDPEPERRPISVEAHIHLSWA